MKALITLTEADILQACQHYIEALGKFRIADKARLVVERGAVDIREQTSQPDTVKFVAEVLPYDE
jgi:hypothetical protein